MFTALKGTALLRYLPRWPVVSNGPKNRGWVAAAWWRLLLVAGCFKGVGCRKLSVSKRKGYVRCLHEVGS